MLQARQACDTLCARANRRTPTPRQAIVKSREAPWFATMREVRRDAHARGHGTGDAAMMRTANRPCLFTRKTCGAKPGARERKRDAGAHSAPRVLLPVVFDDYFLYAQPPCQLAPMPTPIVGEP